MAAEREIFHRTPPHPEQSVRYYLNIIEWPDCLYVEESNTNKLVSAILTIGVSFLQMNNNNN